MARPLISMKNEPVQELVRDGESALLIPPADPGALAKAILKLRDDPALASRISEKGHAQFRTHCTMEVFSRRLFEIVNEMTEK